MPYVDKVKSVKNTGVSQPRWAIWREIWKWSCIPSLLYCIPRKNVDTEYTYYSWCMTSTDIVKWRKNEWLWKFWKRNDLYENFEKKGGSREKGGGGNEIHAPCACDICCFRFVFPAYCCIPILEKLYFDFFISTNENSP